MQLQRELTGAEAIAYGESAYEEAFSAPSVNGGEPQEPKESEVFWTEGDDYSRSLTLSDGKTVVFRDPTGADLKFVESLTGGNIDKTMRLACRLCIKWGDRDGVTPPQLDKTRAVDIMQISKVIESFLS